MTPLIKHKKILAFVVKLLIGFISFWIIYNRISQIPQFKEQCLQWMQEPSIYLTILLALCMMPINWGIESYKWKLITAPVESITYVTALKSMYTAVCLGNLAPARSMEFLGKIYFFKKENKARVTVLHFINGMFQMLITVLVGLVALVYKLNQSNQSSNIVYATLSAGLALALLFMWCIFNIAFIQKKLSYFKWFKSLSDVEDSKLSISLITKLILFSILRYSIFTTQFFIIYIALSSQTDYFTAFTSIAAYFMITSVIPMISFIEPAIRAAIALFVFKNTGNDTSIILSSTLVWLINGVIPSIIGYVIILSQKLQFNTNTN